MSNTAVFSKKLLLLLLLRIMTHRLLWSTRTIHTILNVIESESNILQLLCNAILRCRNSVESVPQRNKLKCFLFSHAN